jgi:hypothetical protein
LSSSTSSSEPGAGEGTPPAKEHRRELPGVTPPETSGPPLGARKWVVLATIVLAFLTLEAVTRTKLFHASKDLSRFEKYPARARALCAMPGEHVVFVGNSLTGEGVDAEQFGTELGVNAGLFVADASHINTWYWLIRHEFYRQGIAPDVMILNFYANSLDDGRRLELGRLAQFFTDRGDWPELFAQDITSLEPRAEFILSSFWATYAVRDRIKERALDLIPDFQDFAGDMNTINFAHEAQRVPSGPKRPATHLALERTMADAKAHDVRLLFVAFPTQPPAGQTSPYEIASDLRQEIQNAGELLLDLREVPQLEKRHYRDEIHLNAEGRTIYTRFLAEQIKATFPELMIAK